jgi:hypothetical protein
MRRDGAASTVGAMVDEKLKAIIPQIHEKIVFYAIVL